MDCFETKEVNASSSYVLLRFQIYWVSSEFATAAAFLLAILDETLSSARQLQPCRAVWKLHGDGWGYNQVLAIYVWKNKQIILTALWTFLCLSQKAAYLCHCNTSPCFCSWILSSRFWMAPSWLQWTFLFGSCHSQTSPGWQIRQTEVRKKSNPFPLSSVPDSSPWLISTERIFLHTFFYI